MAVNMSALHLPFDIQHWSSFHHEFFEYAVPLYNYLKPKNWVMTHSSDPGLNVKKIWRFDKHDKSGWFAAKVACALGYELCVLAGIPMDTDKYKWKDYIWNDLPKEKIRSLSGKTKEFFGGYE